MAVTTLGRQLVKQALPVKYRSFVDEPLTKDRQTKLTTKLAQEDPDGYIDILQNLNNIAQRVISVYGKDTTITLDDVDAGAPLKNMSQKLKELITATINRKDLTQQQKQEKVLQLGYKYTSKMRQLGLKDAHDRKTGLANQIDSGSRGNAVQLMQLIVGDMMMKDAMNRDIPYLAMMPYVQGDSPMSYWASAMSSRKSVYDVQAATGRVGYLSKQATNTTHSTPISMQDCGTSDTGIPVKATDPQNVGSLLLYPWKGHPAGSPITEQMISQAQDDQEFIVRSPTTCKAHNGVCARCAGIQQDGKFPAIGSYVALNAVKSFIEPLTQSGISCLEQNTKVRMADWSVKAIKDIKVGDMVLGCNQQGYYRPTKVTHVFDNGQQEVSLFKYRNGYKTQNTVDVIATDKHRMLQVTRFSNCQQAKFNKIPRVLPIQYVCSNRVLPKAFGPEVPFQGKQEPFALIIGLMLGDGCCTIGNKLETCFSCADPRLIQDIRPYLASLNLQIKLCAGQKIYYRISKISGGKNQRNSLRSKLQEYGIAGKLAHEKRLPQDVFTWSSKSVSQLLSGLIITDGSIYKPKSSKSRVQINFASTSKKMCQQVKDLIQMHCGAHAQPIYENNAGGRKLPLYSVVYNKSSQVIKAAKFLRLYGVKQARRLAIIQKNDIRRPIEALYTCKFISKTPLGKRHVYDLQVEHPSHLYLLEDCVVTHNSKHGSGVGGVKNIDPDGQDQPTGFQSIQRMLLAPRNFPGGAVLAPQDGRVTEIRQAPQGGHFITVAGKTTYAPVARTVTVKVGDVVEAGDTITNGVPNPMQVVKYKGIGQGRHYFTEKLFQLLPKTGAGTKRRNLQQFSRAMINKVRITSDDGYGGYYPGDLVDYDEIADKWQPRDDSKETDIKDSVGRYLEYPALYYSIGTKITPKVAQKMEKYGISKIVTHQDPPPFQPQFVPSKSFVLQDPHWMPRLMGERLQQGLFDAARKGLTDPYDSPSFVDKLIVGPYDPAKK